MGMFTKLSYRQRRCLKFLLFLSLTQISCVILYTQLAGSHSFYRLSLRYSPDVCAPGPSLDLSLTVNVSGQEVNVTGNELCVRTFLASYEAYCQANMFGTLGNSAANVSKLPESKCLCPCVPSTLVGSIASRYTANVTDVMNDGLPGVVGGRWKPTDCIARHRIAIIVPYRDREAHLRTFLSFMHPMLQRQQIDYTIFLSEQVKPKIFNKAMLMNVGFAAVRDRASYDCFIFHDVDMLPMDDRNMFTCSSTPRHVAGYVDKWGFRTFYNNMFGGSVAFSRQYFELVNGYSNTFYGWGGEDDDMFQRTRHKGVKLHARFPVCVAKYRMFRHARDKGNPSLGRGSLGWRYRPWDYKVNGLNSLKYTVVREEQHPLFTRILVNLPDPPPDIQKIIDQRFGAKNATTTASTNTTAGREAERITLVNTFVNNSLSVTTSRTSLAAEKLSVKV